MVDDGVLDLLGAELGVTDSVALTGKIHRQGVGAGEVLVPGNAPGGLVELVGAADLDAPEGQQHPVGKPRPQTHPVGKIRRGFHMDTGHRLPGKLGAKTDELFQQERLKPLGAIDKPLVAGDF